MTGKPRVPRVRKSKPSFVPKPEQHTLFGNGKGMRVNAEEYLQIAIVEDMRDLAPQLTPVHSPNQLARTSEVRILHTNMGMHAGVADLTVYGPNRFVAFLEVKTPGNYASPEQRHFLRLMESNGFVTGVLKSVHDLRAFLQAHGIRTREDIRAHQQDLWGLR